MASAYYVVETFVLCCREHKLTKWIIIFLDTALHIYIAYKILSNLPAPQAYLQSHLNTSVKKH